MNRHSADEYCRHKSAPPGSSFYYSILFYPGQLRRDLSALHAFGVELEEIIAECADPGVMRMKFAWWRDEITRLYQHAGRHPVSLALEDVLTRHDIQLQQLLQLINNMELLGGLPSPRNWRELQKLLEGGPGHLWRLSAEICGHQEQETTGLAVKMGSLFSCFQILQQAAVGDTGPALQISSFDRIAQIRTIREQLELHCATLPAADRPCQLHLLIMGAIISKTCQEILHDSTLQQQRLALTPLRKLWIAWRLRRRYHLK